MTTQRVYAGLRVRVVQADEGVAAVCAELFRQLGAEVTVVDVASLGATEDGDRGDDRAGAAADVLLIDARWDATPVVPMGVLDGWADAGAIVCVFSPFGLSGPLSEHVGSEFTVQARAAILTTNGFEQDPPLMAGVPVATCTSALLGLAAVGAALERRRRTGDGERIDLAAYDAVVSLLGTLLPTFLLESRNPVRVGNRHTMTAPWNTYRTTDGWVVLTIMGQSLWRRFVTMIAREELADDERFTDALHRVANVVDLDRAIGDWTQRYSTDEVLRAAEAAGVPAAPIRTVREALDELRAEESPIFVERDGRTVPGLPFGVHLNDRQPASDPASRRVPRTGSDGPLAGVRVLELSAFTSAPLAGKFLGQLGADVLKVEPPNGENSRVLAQQIEGEGYLYHLNNTDKRGCVLDIADPEQAERLRCLADEADVLLTNLAPSTLERFEVSYDDFRDRAPDLIYTTVTGFRVDGPHASDRAFDTVIQGMSGIMSLTGFPDGPPTKVAISLIDLLAACAATAAVTVGLEARHRTGRGCLVNPAMLEIASWSTQRVWDEVLTSDGDPQRGGNHHPYHHPFGLYAAKDGTVAIDVASEQDRERLRCALDLQHLDVERLEHDLAAAVGERDVDDVIQRLQAQRIPAAVVADVRQLVAHPHTVARGLFQPFELAGGSTVQVIGSPFAFDRADVRVRRQAPALGSDPPVWDQDMTQTPTATKQGAS